jgi:hypothetical protein
VSALEKMSEVHKRLAISIEASNELEVLRTEYIILKDWGPNRAEGNEKSFSSITNNSHCRNFPHKCLIYCSS